MSIGRLVLTGLLLAEIAGSAALGVWQIERRAWKHALIVQVEARLTAAPVSPPMPARWRMVGAADAYTRLRLVGRYRPVPDTYVQAVTDLGPGYWAISALDTDAGTILVNRGFVADCRAGSPPANTVVVTGLLRLSEQGGGFLRRNDPAHDRWYSRDIAAIAAARRLGPVAPFFVDQDAASARTGKPVGGLTVVRFADNHLVYALTWLALTGLSGGFLWRLWRGPRTSGA